MANRTIAIIGGGFSGAAVAYHLARSRVNASVLIFEPRQFVGGGLAYDSADRSFRINVPATKMSIDPSEPLDFSQWLSGTNAIERDLDPGAISSDGQVFPRRSTFGRYVSERVSPDLSSGHLQHVRREVQSIQRGSAGWRVITSDGKWFDAELVVLATTHPSPSVPAPLARRLAGDPRLIGDALKPHALDRIDPDARVLIIGTGLTMADTIASLDGRNHRGKITAISRRGLTSRGHGSALLEPWGTFSKDPATTALQLLQSVRSTIAQAADSGVTWHAVIDAVRAQAQSFWPTLSIEERRRIVRHLRPYWDVHRFRVPPQIKAVLDRKTADGSLDIFAASLVSAEPAPHALSIKVKRRRGSFQEIQSDTVIVTTGPAHDRVISTLHHFKSLSDAGFITPDPIGLGIACDLRGRAIDGSGRPQQTLFIAGPLARGTFGELMGLPQVSEYAKFIAGEVIGQVSHQASPAAATI